MATGLKSRIIYKTHTTDGLWTGAYELLLRAKSIPSPIGEPNMVDCSTLEDLVEIQEAGRKTSNTLTVQGAMSKVYWDALAELEDTELDIMILYGTDGLGSIGKLAFEGKIYVAPDEASDDHLTMSVTISVETVPALVTDDYTVTATENDDGTVDLTVAAAG